LGSLGVRESVSKVEGGTYEGLDFALVSQAPNTIRCAPSASGPLRDPDLFEAFETPLYGRLRGVLDGLQ
jgi:hypothetical protein